MALNLKRSPAAPNACSWAVCRCGCQKVKASRRLGPLRVMEHQQQQQQQQQQEEEE